MIENGGGDSYYQAPCQQRCMYGSNALGGDFSDDDDAEVSVHFSNLLVPPFF